MEASASSDRNMALEAMGLVEVDIYADVSTMDGGENHDWVDEGEESEFIGDGENGELMDEGEDSEMVGGGEGGESEDGGDVHEGEAADEDHAGFYDFGRYDDGDAFCRLCGQFYGAPSNMFLCSQCFADYKTAASLKANAGLVDPAFFARWRPAWRRACRRAAAQYEAFVEEALDALSMCETEFETFVGALPKPQTLAEAVRQLPHTVDALKAKGCLLTPDQALRVAAPCLGLIQGGSLDCFVREHVIRRLHPLVLRQWDMWLDDGRTGCLWFELYQSPVYASGRMKKVLLPVAFDWPARSSSSASGEDMQGTTYVYWRVQVRDRDPCNFASIIDRRQLLRERLYTFASGWHPRLGAHSPLQAFSARPILPKLVAEFLKNDGVYDEVKWLIAPQAK